MPRRAGQIDTGKTEAILDAAGELFSGRGLSVAIDEVARKAGVSKQTIYNRYGSKAELIRAMIARRVVAMTAPLRRPGATENPEEALTAFARELLESLVFSRAVAIMRLTIEAATNMPDIARAVFEAGPRASRRQLAEFLAAEAALGRMDIDRPGEAAEFFTGMVLSSRQMAALMGMDPGLTPGQVEDVAGECARRFMRAYAPVVH
jgi:AcrR family transcriptional regulator